MKKSIISILLCLITSACNLPIPNNSSFEENVATKVSAAKTATMIQEYLQDATNTAKPIQNTPTTNSSTITLTPTQRNFKESLGMPAWRDELNNGGNWNINKPNTDIPNVIIKVENGALEMTHSVTYGGKNWWLNYQKIKDFYLEGKFITQECSGDDQFGLVFRAPNYNDGFGFYFTITCDGNFNLMRWDTNGAVNLFKWEKSEAIQAGAGQTNILGIWAQGEMIRLYANEKMIKEVVDSSFNNPGHFGLFIDSHQTPGFTIKLDEIAYWNLQ